MTIDEALAHLSRQIGLDLRLDADGSCRLVFDGRTVIDVEAPAPARGTVFLHGTVGVLPPPGLREPIYELLLAGNLFGRDTDRAVLAVDHDLGEIVLFRHLDMAAIDGAGFADAIEDMVARVRAWTDRLRQGPPTGRGADTAMTDEMDLHVIRV